MMANDKDFIIKNALEVGKDTKVTLGTITPNALASTYNLAEATYNQSFATTSAETNPTGIFFKPDGTKMYITGLSGDDVSQYSLSTAWDISTATYDSIQFSVVSQELAVLDLFFKPDGTAMYIIGNTSGKVIRYTLSTAWDVSTASYDNLDFTIGATPAGVFFKSDGTKLYLAFNATDDVKQYSLSTAWDVSTATYDSVSLDVTTQTTTPQGIAFDESGTRIIVMGSTEDTVYHYTLSTAWDLSTAAYSGNSLTVSSYRGTTGYGLIFGDSGKSLYFIDTDTDNIRQFNTATYGTVVYLSTGNYFAETLAANTTYTFSNAGDVQAFQLEVTGASTYTITWPASVEWTAGVAPSSPASGETDVYTFVTTDGGTSYIGLQTADNLS